MEQRSERRSGKGQRCYRIWRREEERKRIEGRRERGKVLEGISYDRGVEERRKNNR